MQLGLRLVRKLTQKAYKQSAQTKLAKKALARDFQPKRKEDPCVDT